MYMAKGKMNVKQKARKFHLRKAEEFFDLSLQPKTNRQSLGWTTSSNFFCVELESSLIDENEEHTIS